MHKHNINVNSIYKHYIYFLNKSNVRNGGCFAGCCVCVCVRVVGGNKDVCVLVGRSTRVPILLLESCLHAGVSVSMLCVLVVCRMSSIK